MPVSSRPRGQSAVVELAVTADFGKTWKVHRALVDPNGYEISISCPTTSVCTAVGPGLPNSTVFVGTWGNSYTMKPLQVPSGPSALSLTDCLGQHCIAVGEGDIWETGNAGVSWKSVRWRMPSNLDPSSLRCTLPSTCLIGGKLLDANQNASGSIYVSHDFGQTWRLSDTPSNTQDVPALVCFSDGSCDAFASLQPSSGSSPSSSDILRTADSGGSWRPIAQGISNITSTSCGSPSRCVAASSSGATYKSTNGGRSWSVAGVIRASSSMHLDLNSITCINADTCVTLGLLLPFPSDGIAPSEAFESSDLGSHWHLLSSPPADGTDIFCSGSTCWELAQAPGPRSTASLSTDGGAHWGTPETSAPELFDLEITQSGHWLLVGGDTQGGALVEAWP